MRNKLQLFISALTFLLILNACSSVNPNAVAKYKQENVLGIEIHIPEHIQPGEAQVYTASLTQAGLELSEAEKISFHFWNEDEPVNTFYEMITPAYAGNGLYTAEAILPQDGIYYLQVTASSGGSIVMPTKRFIVGDVQLTEPEPSDQHNHSNHDQHH